MVARAPRRTDLSARFPAERPVASHVPYLRHVDDNIIKTRDGLILTVLKLDGYSFETSDMSEVNASAPRRNDVVRTLANSRFAPRGPYRPARGPAADRVDLRQRAPAGSSTNATTQQLQAPDVR